jgi:hypothetical protein
MRTSVIADWVLRIGVAFAFLFPPINALSAPDAWIGYFPGFVHGYVPDLVLLHAFGVVEVILALWILSGWRIFWPCMLAVVMLVSIVAFNMQEFQILFRDLSIAALALGLGFMHFSRRAPLVSNVTV